MISVELIYLWNLAEKETTLIPKSQTLTLNFLQNFLKFILIQLSGDINPTSFLTPAKRKAEKYLRGQMKFLLT